MKIKRATVLLAIVVLLAAAAWGCGKGESPEPGKAGLETEVVPFLEESIRSMSRLSGYRMRGSMEMNAGSGEVSDSGALRMEIQSEVQNTEGGTNQHMRMDMGGLTTQAYLYGDYFYQEVPGRGWVKTSVAQYQAQNLSTGMIDEDQLRLILESVEEATVRDSGSDTRELSLVLGRDFLLRSLERFREEAGEEAKKQMEEWLSAMEEVADSFNATMRLVIGKDDHLIREMEMVIEMRDVPQLGTYRSRMFMEVYDYNAEVSIELPAEAEKAVLQ